jgi:hypothetical protein
MMNSQAALQKKCPFQFNEILAEFNYCITSDCMSWNEEKGGCLRLLSCECKNKTASDIDQAGIRA